MYICVFVLLPASLIFSHSITSLFTINFVEVVVKASEAYKLAVDESKEMPTYSSNTARTGTQFLSVLL